MSLLVVFALTAHAGPWVKGPGEAYGKAYAQRFVSKQYVDADNRVVDLEGARFEGDRIGVYAEAGLGHGLGVVVGVPWVSGRNVVLEPRVAYAWRSLGDVEVGLQAGRRLAGVPVSVSVVGKVPGYNVHDRRILPGQRLAFPIPGDGQVDVTALAAVGGGGALGWAAGELGYRSRSGWYPFDPEGGEAFADGVVWHGQGGLTPRAGDRSLGWWVVDVSGVHNLRRDTRTKQYVQLGTSVAPRVWESEDAAVHVEVGASWIPVSRNASRGWAGSVGVSAQR